MPGFAQIGGLSFVLALFVFAQRLNGWQNRKVAAALNFAAAVLLVVWCFAYLPRWAAWLVAFVVWNVALWFTAPFIYKRFQMNPSPAPPPGTAHAKAVLSDAPSVFMEYSDQPNGAAKLVLRNERPRVANHPVIRSLVSKDVYEAVYRFCTTPEVLPAIHAGTPVECELRSVTDPHTKTGRSLSDVLATATPGSVDTVVIDYDDSDGNEFSRVFALTRNSDGTVTWSGGPVQLRNQLEMPVPWVQDLAELRFRLVLANGWHKEHMAAEQYAKQLQDETARAREMEKIIVANRATMQAATRDLMLAGKLLLLAENALELSDWLSRIIGENSCDPNPIDLSKPLSRDLIFIDPAEPGTVSSWQRRRLMSFRDQYDSHRRQFMDCSLSDCRSRVPFCKLPTDSGADEFISMLMTHRTFLLERASSLAVPYVEASRVSA